MSENKTNNCLNIYCDSLEALDNLQIPEDCENFIVKTSSPAVMFDSNYKVFNIERRWNKADMSLFQGSIKDFSIDVYESVIKTKVTEREVALCASLYALHFQKIMYKAACINDNDFNEKSIFLKVEDSEGINRKNINFPWDKILNTNKDFYSSISPLKNKIIDTNTEKKASLFRRLKSAGFETVSYRILYKILKILPNFSNKEVLVHGENELIIETLYNLIIKGIKIRKINLCSNTYTNGIDRSESYNQIVEAVLPVYRNRSKLWLSKKCEKPCEKLFIDGLVDSLCEFYNMSKAWKDLLEQTSIITKDTVVISNAPGNLKGLSLSFACKKLNFPLISFQHGVTSEISSLHSERIASYDCAVSDYSFYFNKMSSHVENKSYFSKSKPYVVGMSYRHTRMPFFNRFSINHNKKKCIPFVYVSTNLYKGNIGLFSVLNSDFERALKEYNIIKKVLVKMPYKVRYKTYPEENKRYPDLDPVIKFASEQKNIDIFQDRIDMRYLISEHRVFITTGATSTLSWLIMSGKPVIFINQKNKSPLTKSAEEDLSKSLFLFNDSKGFYERLLKFLSQPIEDIENKWKEKEKYRSKTIKKYFTEYNLNAGKRAASTILEQCF